MNNIEIIRKKIEQIENLLAEIKNKLEMLGKESANKPVKQQRKKEEILPSFEELKAEYDRLYQEYINSGQDSVSEFIRGKSKVYLEAFCKANNLPINVCRTSKDKIVDVVLQWMAQRKALTQRAI
jgi:hypothetical protein